LRADEYRSVKVLWKDGRITVSQKGKIILDWKDHETLGVSHFGVKTTSAVTGFWKIKNVDPNKNVRGKHRHIGFSYKNPRKAQI